MDFLTKRIQEKLLARGRAEQARADEWRRSLKPTVYRGNNLFQEMGGEPIEGRYLGQQGLVPGQSVPNIGRNPNKPVIPGLPVSSVQKSESSALIYQTSSYSTIYDTWTDFPQSGSQRDTVTDVAVSPPNKTQWYQYFESENYRIVMNEPAGTPIPLSPRPSTAIASFSQYLNTQRGSIRLVTTGADDLIGVTIFKGTESGVENLLISESISYPGNSFVSDWVRVSSGNKLIAVGIVNLIPSGAGGGFKIEFAPAIVVTSED